MRAASAASARVARASASSARSELGPLRVTKAARLPASRVSSTRAVGQHDAHARPACGSCSARCRSTCRSRCWRRCRRSSRRRSTPGRGRSCARSGASRRLAAAPITPGCSVIVAPSALDTQPRQPSPSSTQHRVADRLAGQAGAGGAERHRRAAAARSSASTRTHLVLVLDHHDDLRHQPVEAGVGAPGQQAQRIGDEPRGRQRSEQRRVDPVVRWRQRFPDVVHRPRPPVSRPRRRAGDSGTSRTTAVRRPAS